jgi:hypothetical protein
MAAGVPELVKHVSTIDSTRVPEAVPVLGQCVHWTAQELTTLEELMERGKSMNTLQKYVLQLSRRFSVAYLYVHSSSAVHWGL